MARTKDAKNLTTNAWNIMLDFVENKGMQKYMDILNRLDGKEFIDAYNQVLNYFKPKLTHNKNDNTNTVVHEYKAELEILKAKARQIQELSEYQNN